MGLFFSDKEKHIASLLFNYFRYKNYTQNAPDWQQGFLRKKWSVNTKIEKMLYKANDKVFSFMVARHPFERILSAYR